MMTIADPRRRAGQRISSALWGLLVAGVGVMLIASYSGYDIDLELAAIIVLAAIGGWLLLSAAVSGIGRKREISRATAPTVEERVDPAPSSEVRAAEWHGDASRPDDKADRDDSESQGDAADTEVDTTAELPTDGEPPRA
ncbi:hypothetical protein ACNI3K_04575 [Demequina sp. SO4-13]|uniref:hypothetical protein n=1 Tax=Demequina sp. SO4-13 TaxID=3401027 RepID=UPI003AF8B09F